MNRRRRSLLLLMISLVLFPAGARAGTVDLATSGSPRIDGPAAGSGFGTAALATGDINGDGAVDVVIGAPDALQGRGAVYCILGVAGQLPVSRNLATTPADLTITGPAPGSRLGVAAVVADLDGDGTGELVVSTGGYVPSFGRLASGGALIFHGGAGLVARRQIDLAVDRADVSVVDSTFGVPIGAALAAGDVNHDRYDDVVIGAPAAPGLAAQVHAGRVYVVPGREVFRSGEIIEAATDADVWMAVGTSAGDEAGTTLAVGDVDRDLLDDVVIGMPNSTVTRAVTFEKAGRVAVVAGGRFAAFAPVDLSSGSSMLVLGSDYGDYFGFGVAAADVTGDGLPDVVASAIDGDGVMNRRYPDCGEVFTIESAAGAGPQRIVDLMDEASWMRVIGDVPKRFLGGGLGAGDMDGDRRAEIVASSKSAPGPNGMESGIVYVFRGAMTTVDLAETAAETSIYGPGPQSAFGSELRVVDLNGDGVADVLASAPGAQGGRGSVYVIPGVRTVPDTAPVIEPIADVTLGQGQDMEVLVHATDPEGDPIRMSIAGRPPHSTFVDGGDGNGSLAIGPPEPGTDMVVRIIASDGQLSSSTTFHVRYSAFPAPVVTKAVYRNGALKVTGQNFSAGAALAINGHTVALPVSFNASKGRLRVKGSQGELGLLPGAGTNMVVVTANGVASAPFQF